MQSDVEDQDEYEHAYHEDRVPRQWLPPYDGTTQPPLSTCLSPGTSLRSASSLSLSVSDTSSHQRVGYVSTGSFASYNACNCRTFCCFG